MGRALAKVEFLAARTRLSCSMEGRLADRQEAGKEEEELAFGKPVEEGLKHQGQDEQSASKTWISQDFGQTSEH